MYLVINKCVTAVKVSNFYGHYLRNRSTLGIGVLGYIGIVQHTEHSPEVLSIPPGTPCINVLQTFCCLKSSISVYFTNPFNQYLCFICHLLLHRKSMTLVCTVHSCVQYYSQYSHCIPKNASWPAFVVKCRRVM